MSSTNASRILDAIGRMGVQDVKNERQFTVQLAEMLNARAECPYAATRARCDIVLNGRGGTTWIEAKLAQTYFSQQQPARDNRPLMQKHLFSEAPSEHTALNDIKKLNSLLGVSGIASLGYLLVFYYSRKFPLAADVIAEFRARAHLEYPWQEFSTDELPNPNLVEYGAMIRAYYWERSAGLESSSAVRLESSRAEPGETRFRCCVHLYPDDSGFSALGADLPGVISEGESQQEALQNVVEAYLGIIGYYVAKREPIPWLPERRTLHECGIEQWVEFSLDG